MNKWIDKLAEVLSSDNLEFGIKAIVVGFMNFFTFIFAMLSFFIPIDLTWRTIGQVPAILLGALCLFIYSCVFAVILVKGTEKATK